MARGENRTIRDYISTRIAAEDRGHSSPCWIWQRFLTSKGYAYAWVPGYGRNVRVHRAAFEEYVGAIANGLQIDHLCRQRDCVNPAHLEAVSARENTMRGEAITAQMARKTHCVHGHELTAENMSPRRGGGRRCLVCARRANAEQRAKSVATPDETPGRGSGHIAPSAAEDREIAPHGKRH